MEITMRIGNRKRSVFLGGTCNGSEWRDRLIEMLRVPYFNPVVPNWTPECMAKEVQEREVSSQRLYVITPKMTGIFSIAELTEDAIRSPNHTIACFLPEDGEAKFTDTQWKSITQVIELLKRNGCTVVAHLEAAADILNLRLSDASR